MSRLGKKIKLLSGQHIEAANTNSIGNGVPYLTGPADFVGKKPVATKYTEFPKVCCDPESANLFWLDYALSDSVTILPSLSPRGAEITPAPWLLKKVTLYFGFRIVFSPF